MSRSRLVRLFTEDVGAKALALFSALLLWVAVSFLGTQTVTAENVPVTVTNLRDELALVSEIAPVRVRFRAPRLLLQRRQPADLVRAFVDLSGRGLGAQSAEVVATPSDSRVDILVVLPARVTFALDPVVQRALPVQVVPEGDPADGFKIGEATAEPTTVQVRGALGRIQQISVIEAKISVRGASAPVEGEVALSPPDTLSVSPDRVRVKLEIVQAETTKTLGVRVVTQGAPAAGFWVRSVTTDPSAITVRGSQETLGARTFIETAPVSVNEARSPVAKQVELAVPEGVTVVGGEPRVQVTVDVAPLSGTKDVTAAVHVGDAPDGLRVTTVSPGTLRVTVQGSGEAFDRLRGEDVRIVLSAQGRGAGTFAVQPSTDNVRAPEGIRVVSVERVDVNVTLEGA